LFFLLNSGKGKFFQSKKEKIDLYEFLIFMKGFIQIKYNYQTAIFMMTSLSRLSEIPSKSDLSLSFFTFFAIKATVASLNEVVSSSSAN